MTPEDKVKLFYMANLYYMAGGNVPKRYANGSMVMPNQLQPSMPVMEQPNADLSTTKSLTALGMNPAIMGATGGASAAIAPIAGLAIDAWKFNRAMDNSYDQNAMMAEAVKKQQRQSSPYNTETGYMQGNFAHGGTVPIWRMLSDDPSQFQMDENNNQQGGGNSSNYNTGGGIHIKEENRGKFTASAKRAGEGVQEHARHVLSDPNASPLQKKRANFARNAAKWHHADGGGIGYSIERDALLNNSSAPYAEGGAMSDPPTGGWVRKKGEATVVEEGGSKDDLENHPSSKGWTWYDDISKANIPSAPASVTDRSTTASKPLSYYAQNYSSQGFSDIPNWNVSGSKDTDALRVDTLQQPGTGVTTNQQASDISGSLLFMGNTTPDFNPYVSRGYDQALQYYQQTPSGSGTGEFQQNSQTEIPDEVGSRVGPDFMPISSDKYRKPLYFTNPQSFFDQQDGNYAKGGNLGQRRSYPGWQPYGSNPSLFQMNQNNNNSPGYDGGGSTYEDGGPMNNQALSPNPNLRLQPVGQNPSPSGVHPYGFSFIDKKMDVYGGGAGMAGYQNIGNNTALTGSFGFTGVHTPYNSNVAPGFNIGITKKFNNGGSTSDEYGIIPGNGNPKADDKTAIAELGAFVVPADKVFIAKKMLGKMGLNPDQQLSTMAPGAAKGGTPIRISSKEMYLSPDVKESMKLDMGMTDYDFEKTLSPNSPHNQHYTDPYLQHAKPSEWRNQGTNKFVQADHKVMEGQHLSPTLYAMARFADGGGFSDWWYNNMRSPQYREQNFSRSEMQQMAAEDEANLNNPDYSTEREINARNNAAAPEGTTTTPGSDLPEDFQKMNRNLLIANTVSSAGQGIYNLMQKYTPMPKPQMYRPEMYNADTSAMEEAMNRETQKAAATARYNARNVNQTYGTNAAIHANELESQISNAAKIQAMNADQAYKNTELKNQASLFNLQNQQSAAVQDSQNRYNFRAMKGQAVSQNIQAGLKGYQNYVNADLGMRALEKGYKAGMVDSQLYQKALNDPQSLTKEEIARINAITGGNFDPSKLVTETTAVE